MKIKKVVLYNPAVSSLNMGDHIIYDGVSKQIKGLIESSFNVEVSTHLPVSKYLKLTRDFDYKFVCGSNLLKGKMDRGLRQWDINILNANIVGPSILVGAGWHQYGDDPNLYTKKLYDKVLSKEYYHSVRDSYTEQQLNKIGIKNVINTSCPTMWDLTAEHCSDIPVKKAGSVVCTITDYNKDYKRDKTLFEILCRNYENVYFWVQGDKDLDYFNDLEVDTSKIQIINPNLQSYDLILEEEVDYVGTRLHAGIRALQRKKRTIIIGIDNRALEKQKDFNINVVHRKDIDMIESVINSEFETKINIPTENIKKWKKQFGLVH